MFTKWRFQRFFLNFHPDPWGKFFRMGWNQPSAALTGSLNRPLGVFESRITPAQGGGCSVQEAIAKRSKIFFAGKGKGAGLPFLFAANGASQRLETSQICGLPRFLLLEMLQLCEDIKKQYEINFCSRLDIPWLLKVKFLFQIIYTYCTRAWKETLVRPILASRWGVFLHPSLI